MSGTWLFGETWMVDEAWLVGNTWLVGEAWLKAVLAEYNNVTAVTASTVFPLREFTYKATLDRKRIRD